VNIRRAFALLAICLSSCSGDVVGTADLQAYIADPSNGLTKNARVNGIDIEASYVPTDLIILQFLKNKSLNELTIDSMRLHYSRFHYFTLTMSVEGNELVHADPKAYGELLQVISFRMGDYVKLASSENVVAEPINYSTNRTYGMAGATELLFVFENTSLGSYKWLQINLKEFGMGTGNVSFRFKANDLNDLPGLDFNENKPQS
jgi:hypothetical protein